MVGAVGEMAYMKRRKLWKTGEDGLCCSSSAIQTQLGPSSLLVQPRFALDCKKPRFVILYIVICAFYFILLFLERQMLGASPSHHPFPIL